MATSLKVRNTNAIFFTRKLARRAAIAAALGALAVSPATYAQTFSYTNNDLALGFRKNGIHKESYEAVVNIGQATNYAGLQPGTTISVPNYTASQLSDSFSDLTFLSWSVVGVSKTNNAAVLPGYPKNVLWLTVPRTDPNTPTPPPQRLTYTAQGSVGVQIASLFSGAAYLAAQASAGPDSTATFVREDASSSSALTAFIGSSADSSQATLRDAWPLNLETTTSGNFTAPSIADFYEVRPTTDPQNNPVTDPHTSQSSGDAYYVGYFTLSPDGTMKFTRGSSGTVTNPPSAPTLTVSRSGNTTQIRFTSEKGATYKLYYTDATGLSQPLVSWATVPNTITGDGSAQFFSDTTTDTARFYRVSAQ